MWEKGGLIFVNIRYDSKGVRMVMGEDLGPFV